MRDEFRAQTLAGTVGEFLQGATLSAVCPIGVTVAGPND